MSSTNYFDQNGTNAGADVDDIDDDNLNDFITDYKDGSDDDDDETHVPIIFQDSDDDMEYNPDGEPIEDDDDDVYDFKDALRGAAGLRVKNKSSQSKSYFKRKMMRASNRELDPEVRENLSRANEAFVRNDFQVALNLYLEVIKKDPKNFSAYKTLGEIYKQQGRLNDCCNSWLLAANIHPWDTQFWGNVADLSAELGHKDQAIYCYGKAITSDINKSARYILERAILYKEKKSYGRALEGFQKIRQVYPKDPNVIKYLASVYAEQKRLNDAINLYMRALDYNINRTSTNQVYPKFGWTELNILLELYMQQHSWRVGVKVIKLVSRWIQNRSDETWWDETDDDSEFDKRRFAIIATRPAKQQQATKDKFYNLPIDIRFKLGCFRLGLDQKAEAIIHFEFLLEEEEDIGDLFFEAGKALEEHGYHEEALPYLTRASESEEFQGMAELINLLGKCFLEVGDYSQAKFAYQTLLQNDKKNDDYRLSLAEALFHLGKEQESQKLLQEVELNHKDMAHKQGSVEAEDINGIKEEDNDNEVSSALIKNEKLVKRSTKLTEQEKVDIEEKAKRNVLDKHRRMERLKDSINNGDKIAIKTWMQLAAQLVEMFMSVRSFFPRDKNRTFKGIVLYRRKKQMGIDEKIARVYNLYEGIVNDENYSRQFLTSKTEYRGLSYDEWFMIFIQYAILLNKIENNLDYSCEIIDLCMTVSVFVQDKTKEQFLRLIRLIIGIENEEYSTSITTYVRFFLMANQFSPFIFKLFLCCFTSGIKAWETFSNYNHQKFFLRQLKAWDSIKSGTKISGMATITANVDKNLQGEHPDILYVYSNLLGGNRSYVSSVVYLTRAYKEYNQDPMICLSLGLAHVHRSMQRLSTNRHMQLLQGISYILEYRDLRSAGASDYELQEIEYNMGRLFHMLGLTSLAVTHYEKVLEFHGKLDEEYDMSVEAAYNLTLIYNINGNSQLARAITEKYLTI